MAKKKKKHQGQQFLSPETFIRQRARSLDIGKCYVNEEMEEYGEGYVVVSRNHTGGRVSVALFLLDIWCVGVKDSFFRLRLEEEEFKEFIDSFPYNIRECSYEEAHNWIFGAIEFAEEAGIAPDKSFNLTQYMLEEDDDNIPLIEYNFGKDGKHFLVAGSGLETGRYLPLLEKNLGKGNYEYILNSNDDDSDDLNEEEVADWCFGYNVEDMPYTYQHPDYPNEISLKYPWIQDELSKPENAIYLKDELTDRILALPQDELRQDMENLIMYHIGLTCDDVPLDYGNGEYNGLLSTCLMLLAEVGNSDSSLDCVMEVLRQSQDFFDYHFGDSFHEVGVPTLYKLAQHRLDRLMAFIKEPGLYWLPKAEVMSVVKQVGLHAPERRTEVIAWFREVIHFCIEHVAEGTVVDCEVTGLLMCELVDLQAVELIPEINALFDTKMVNLGCCGRRDVVLQDINNPKYAKNPDSLILDIHKRFDDMRMRFANHDL